MFSRFIFDIVFDIRVFRGHHLAICFLLVLYVVFLILVYPRKVSTCFSSVYFYISFICFFIIQFNFSFRFLIITLYIVIFCCWPMIYLSVIFVVFILFGMCWAFWISKLIFFFTKFEKKLTIVSSDILSATLSPSYSRETPITHVLYGLILSWRSLRFYF